MSLQDAVRSMIRGLKGPMRHVHPDIHKVGSRKESGAGRDAAR